MDSPPDRVVPATPAMALRLAETLRAEHVREIREIARLSPVDALLASIRSSVESYALTDAGGGTVFMMGVEPAGAVTSAALVWMVGTPRIDSQAAAVMRAARWGVRRAFAVTGALELEQYIPAWYRTGIAFVLRLGFRLAAAHADAGRGGEVWRVRLRREDAAIRKTKTRSGHHGSIEHCHHVHGGQRRHVGVPELPGGGTEPSRGEAGRRQPRDAGGA